MVRLEMKSCNTILTVKQQRYQHYYQVKLLQEYLTDQERLPSSQCQIVEQAKLTCSPVGKALEKQKRTIEDPAKKKQKQLKI